MSSLQPKEESFIPFSRHWIIYCKILTKNILFNPTGAFITFSADANLSAPLSAASRPDLLRRFHMRGYSRWIELNVWICCTRGVYLDVDYKGNSMLLWRERRLGVVLPPLDIYPKANHICTGRYYLFTCPST